MRESLVCPLDMMDIHRWIACTLDVSCTSCLSLTNNPSMFFCTHAMDLWILYMEGGAREDSRMILYPTMITFLVSSSCYFFSKCRKKTAGRKIMVPKVQSCNYVSHKRRIMIGILHPCCRYRS